jgi:hypothetical protein
MLLSTAKMTSSRGEPVGGAPVLIATLAATAVFAVTIAAPLVTGRQLLASDLGDYYYGYRDFFSHALKAGDSPYWCPNVLSGIYLHGDGHMGMMHPWQRLVYGLLPLSAAIPLETLSWFALLFSGALLLFRKWGSTVVAACAGAFVLSFGGRFFLWMIAPNFVAVLAHLPWLLLAIHEIVESESPYRTAAWSVAVACLTGSQLLLGSPQMALDSVIVEVLYLLLLFAPRAWIGRAGWLVSAKAAGALLGAAQLLPTWTALGHSVRAAPTIEFLGLGSIHPYNWLQWINPFILNNRHFGEWGLHEYGVYPGVAAILLVVWFCFTPSDTGPGRRVRRFLLVTGIAGLVLSMGKYNGIFPLYGKLPLMGLFRCPGRYYILTSFAIAGLCALGIDAFLGGVSTSARVRRNLTGVTAVYALFGLAASLAAVTFLRSSGLFYPASKVMLGCGIAVLASGLFTIAMRQPAWRSAFLVLLVFDLGFYHFTHLTAMNRSSDPASLVPRPPVGPPGPVYSSYPVGNRNLLTAAGYRMVNGYVGLVPRSELGLESPTFRLLGGSTANEGDQGWAPVPDAFSRVRLLSSVLVTADPARDATSVDLAKTALAPVPLDLDARATGRPAVVEDRPGKIRLTVEASGKMLAALNERFDPGWTARLDGAPATALRVNGDFLGVAVPPGRHTIELLFDPQDLRYGIKASMCGLLLLMLYPAAAWVRIRTRKPAKLAAIAC